MGAHVRPLSSPQTRSEFEGKKREADRPNPDIVFKFNENAINHGLFAKYGYDSCEDHGLMSVCKNVSGAFPQPPLVEGGGEAERLNRGCFCITLDRHALTVALNREVVSPYFAKGLAASAQRACCAEAQVDCRVGRDCLALLTQVIERDPDGQAVRKCRSETIEYSRFAVISMRDTESDPNLELVNLGYIPVAVVRSTRARLIIAREVVKSRTMNGP
jgi:hypothetical protein